MRYQATFRKWDVLVVFGCLVFALAGLGAVGSSGRRRAKEAVCLSNLQKWGVAWQAFLVDNGGVGPENLSSPGVIVIYCGPISRMRSCFCARRPRGRSVCP
ncbi:MAG: hypothetical protein ACYTEQ_20565 [Planctomycetota bacterium]